jgi:hypothetical protein
MRIYRLNNDQSTQFSFKTPQGKRLLMAVGIVIAALALVSVLVALPGDLDGTLAVLALLVVGLPMIWLIWREPVFGLIGIVFLNASFLPASALDLRVGFGGLDLIDLGLLGLLGVLVIRQWRAGKLVFPWWRVSAPLLLFIAIALFSTLYALFYRQVDANFAFSELRPLIYLLTFFATAWAITQRKQLLLLIAALFIVADLVVGVVLWQQFLGLDNPLIPSVMAGPGRTWLLWSVPGLVAGFGAVRVVPAGHVLTFTMSIVAFCGFLYSRLSWRWRALFAGQFLFLSLGLLLTYTRAQWIASAIAVLLALGAYMVLHRRRVFSIALVGLTLILVGLGVLGASSIGEFLSQSSDANPLLVRLASIFTPDQTLDTSSLQWRLFENDVAVQSIDQNPWLGVGLGNEYRGATLLRQRELIGDLRFTRFIHNAYLYIAAKMGLPALAVFAWLCLAFLISGWRSYRWMQPGIWQPIILAMLASFVGVLFWSNTQPNFMVEEGALFIGVLMGLVAAGLKLGLGQEQVD